MSLLEALADLASILTAIIAAAAYVKFQWWDAYCRRKRFRAFMATSDREMFMDELIRDLWMSEGQIFEASRNCLGIETGIIPGGGVVPARLWFRRADLPIKRY